MRARVERERGKVPAGSRHLRFDPGGIMDVEFLVALGQLRHGARPGVRTTSTAALLDRLVALGWPAACATTTPSCGGWRCACASCTIARRR